MKFTIIVILMNLQLSKIPRSIACSPDSIPLTRIVSETKNHNVKYRYTVVGLFPGRVVGKLRYNRSGYVWMEVAKFAIAEVNKFLQSLSPPICLDYIIYDTCNDLEMASHEILEILLDKKKNSEELKYNNIIGIIGPASSSTVDHLIKLLKFESMPLISYSATSIKFDDKMKYPHFLRTIPADDLQSQMMRDVLFKFEWSYVSIIASDNEYGRMGYDHMEKHFKTINACTSVQRLFKYPYNDEEIESILLDLKEQDQSTVVILWASGIDTQYILKMAYEYKIYNKTWILSESAAKSPVLLTFEKSFVQGILGVAPYSRMYEDFQDFFYKLKYNKKSSFWLKNLFERLFLLTEKDFGASLDDFRELMPHTKDGYVRNAVYAYANALKNLILEKKDSPDIPASNRSYFFRNYLSKVIFQDGNTNVSFGNDGNAHPNRFHLFSIQAVRDKLEWQKIGEWNQETKLSIVKSNFSWVGGSDKVPLSRCSDLCEPGFYGINHGTKTCCWLCTPCQSNYVKSDRGYHLCTSCGPNSRTNKNKTECKPIQLLYLTRKDPLFMWTCILTATGTIICLAFIFIFIKYRATPVVISSNLSITLMQILTLLILNISLLLFLLNPTKLLCLFRIGSVGILVTLGLTITLSKTQQYIQIFRRRSVVSKKEKRISTSIEFSMVIFFLLFEILLLFSFYILNEVNIVEYDVSGSYRAIHCSSKNLERGQSVYIIMQSLICGVQGFRGRKLPQNYKETKYISFIMFTTSVVICVSTILQESMSNENSKIQVFVLSYAIVSWLLLLTLYGKKIWIILFRPKKNSRKVFDIQRMTSIERKITKKYNKALQSTQKRKLGVVNQAFQSEETRKSTYGFEKETKTINVIYQSIVPKEYLF